jgi:hypothetical protein
LAQIEYLPYQKIILHEIMKMEPSAFFPFVASQVEAQKSGNVAGAMWIDGIAFGFGEFPETPETVQEKLKGRLHKAVVWYTETSFQPEKKIQVNGRDLVVKLMRADKNQDLVNLVEFLKEFKPKISESAGVENAPE